MTAISDTSPTPFQAQVAGDIAAIMGAGAGGRGEFGTRAVYRSREGGAEDERELTIVINCHPEEDQPPAAGGIPQNTHRRRRCQILVGADPDADDIGGVRRLQSRDVFEVPGAAVGRPDVAQVVVTVGEGARLTEQAVWTAEATIT